MMKSTNKSNAAGLTLIELLIVVFVMSILLAIAVPSYRVFIQEVNLTTQVNTLSSVIHFARSEAIGRGNPVRVNALGVEWQEGLAVESLDQNGHWVELRRIEEVNQDIHINSQHKRITFFGNGFASADNQVFICNKQDNQLGRVLVMNRSGRVQICQLTTACNIEAVGYNCES